MTLDPITYSRLGPEALGEAELLGLALANPSLAAELLDEFGAAAGLLAATPAMLSPRLGRVRAARLHAALTLARRALEGAPRRARIRSARDAAAWLTPRLAGLPHEELHALLLNRRFDLLSLRRLSQGSADHTLFDVRLILGEMLRTGAHAVVLGHNHPSGDPEPSSEDILVTRRAVEGANLLGLSVIDHLVVAGGEWVSLTERGHIAPARGPSPDVPAVYSMPHRLSL